MIFSKVEMGWIVALLATAVLILGVVVYTLAKQPVALPQACETAMETLERIDGQVQINASMLRGIEIDTADRLRILESMAHPGESK